MELTSAAARLADVLRRHGRRIVFAASCTAGLVSAALQVLTLAAGLIARSRD